MRILAAAGDPGGARALLPVLGELSGRHEPFAIVDHGFLSQEAPEEWHRVPPEECGGSPDQRGFDDRRFRVLAFTTSVKDPIPLRIARAAGSSSASTICLLDNWMSYRYRLEMDGLPLFIPDRYLVMDELAMAEARADGIAEEVLQVSGHPGLATLGEGRRQRPTGFRKSEFERLGLDPDRKLLVFLSEPAATDQGDGPEYPRYRGYTEITVIRELCRRLQPLAHGYQLGIIPHPREKARELEALWEGCAGALTGGILSLDGGRQGVQLADGVAGMASILLYEAWLLNRPVISLQPGLLLKELDSMRERPGALCVTRPEDWDPALDKWLTQLSAPEATPSPRPELALHEEAPGRIADILIESSRKVRKEEPTP